MAGHRRIRRRRGAWYAVAALAAALNTIQPAAAEPLLINHIAVAPSSPSVLYAAGRPAGILKSTDRGLTWAPAREGILNTSAYHVVVHPKNAEIAYVGTFGGGVYRTRDGGRSWDAVSHGLGNTNIHALALDSSRPERVIASTSTGEVFQTTDSGGRWTPYGEGLPVMDGEVLAALLIRSGLAWLGQGTLFSRGGRDAAWRTVGQDLSRAAISALAADSQGRFYAGTRRQGLFRSVDQGTTWTRLGAEFERGWVRLVLAGPGATPRLYVSVLRRGLFRSNDGGDTWAKVGAGLPPDDDVEALAMDPVDPDRLYAGTHDHGLLVSVDGGLRFRAPDQVIQEPVASVIASLIDKPVRRDATAGPTPPAAFQKCSGCHGWADPVLSRKPTYWRVAPNQRDWAPTVARMAPGAGLTADEQRQVTEFLTRYTAPR
jgi:photosystem II stability/assembly factor-like uncharacterized protein